MPVAVAIAHELWQALSFAFGMTWEVLWALILGFALSGAVQAVVSKREMRRLMPDDSPKTLAIAAGLGAASSSCSYASVALARSLFRKGADFTAAMAFEIASTNLVIELGIIMALLLGWQFVLGEFVGGPLMIVFLATLFRIFLKRRLVDEARAEAEKGRLGSMECHAAMDLPIDDFYRRYYGWRMAGFLLGSFYATMVAAGLAVEFLFQALGLERHARDAKVEMASVSWNYTTYLNIVFLLLAAALVWRYFRRGGGWAMLRMMDTPMSEAHHTHADAHT